MKVIFFILLFTVSCKKNNDSNTSTTYTIGQSFGGGKIFYIDGTGKHGLIVAPNDQSLSAVFWDNGSIVENPRKLTPSRQMKLTPFGHFKLTP